MNHLIMSCLIWMYPVILYFDSDLIGRYINLDFEGKKLPASVVEVKYE